MKLKIISILLLVVFIISVGGASAFPGPVNVTTVNHTDHVHLAWDANASAVNFTVYEYHPTIMYSNTTPVLDGLWDDAYNISTQFILTTPEPTYDDAYDTIRIIRDATHAYIYADTNDIGTDTGDDTVQLYVDFDSDGLTNSIDKSYEVEEDGTVTRYQWNTVTNSWKKQPGSAANAIVTGAGTSSPQYELQIPFSELTGYNNVSRTLLWERSSQSGATRVYSHSPLAGSPLDLDTSSWIFVYLSHAVGSHPSSATNTTNNYYQVDDLDPFTYYLFGVSLWNATLGESDITTVEAITSTSAMYNLSGYVYDESTGDPIRNADISASYVDGFPHAATTTNVSGYYYIDDIWSDTYEITAIKDGYVTEIITITINGGDLPENEIFMQLGGQEYIPVLIWLCLVFVTFIGIVYGWLRKDRDNYTDIIAMLISTITASICAYTSLGGIGYTVGETVAIYQSNSLGLLFGILAVVTALYLVIQIYEVFVEESRGWMKQ